MCKFTRVQIVKVWKLNWKVEGIKINNFFTIQNFQFPNFPIFQTDISFFLTVLTVTYFSIVQFPTVFWIPSTPKFSNSIISDYSASNFKTSLQNFQFLRHPNTWLFNFNPFQFNQAYPPTCTSFPPKFETNLSEFFHSVILDSHPGFLSTDSRASPGNYGLKDIVQALRWIQENIRSFNGDPNKVTLWGHSAGAAAIHMLALNRKTEGLFNRYILQSGFAVSPWAVNPRSLMRRVALDVANYLYCLPSKRERRKEGRGDEEMENEASEESALNVTISLSGMEDVMEKYSEEEEEEMMKCLRSVEVEELGSILDYYYVREYFIFPSPFLFISSLKMRNETRRYVIFFQEDILRGHLTCNILN